MGQDEKEFGGVDAVESARSASPEPGEDVSSRRSPEPTREGMISPEEGRETDAQSSEASGALNFTKAYDPETLRLVATLDAMPAILAIVDSKGAIVAVNSVWRRFAEENGYDHPFQGLGENYLEVCDRATGRDAEGAAEAAAGIRAVIEGRQPSFFLEYPCHSSTARRWFRLMVYPERSGVSDGVVLVHEDITARCLAEEALRFSEQRYRHLFEAMVQGVVYLDAEGKIILANPAAERILGMSFREMATAASHDTAWDTLREDGTRFPLDEHPSMVALRTGREVRDVVMGVYNPREKNRRWICLHAVPESPGDGGKPHRVCVTFDDITERLLAERERTRFFAVMEQATDSVVIVDPQGVVEYVNPAFERATGYAKAEMVGRTEKLLRTDAHDSEFYRSMWKTLHSGKIWKGRTVNKKKGGGLVHEDVAITPVHDTAGRIVNFVEIKRDVTQQIESEARIRHQQMLESLGTLASGVAHEINNPVNGIMNYAQLIADGAEPGVRAHEFATEIVRETERIAEIVKGLLTLSRQESLSYRPARVGEVVEAALTLTRTLFVRDGIALDVRLDDTLPSVFCHDQQIRQVVLNLLTNARDALNRRYPGGHHDKRILLTARRHDDDEGRWVRVTVEDNGSGVSPEIRDRIFDPFFTTKPRDRGTGLGLSICLGIVHEHEGRLTCESAPGRGARFHIDLPILPPPSDPDTSGEESALR